MRFEPETRWLTLGASLTSPSSTCLRCWRTGGRAREANAKTPKHPSGTADDLAADIDGPMGVPDGCVDDLDLLKVLAEWCSSFGGNPCGTCLK